MRGGIWTVLFLAVWFLAEPPGPYRSFLGLVLVALGQMLRFWAAGCITRYRERMSRGEAYNVGPYGIVRNPLRSNWLIGAGWGYSPVGRRFPFVLSFWILYCTIIVPYEEEYLSKTFGDEYSSINQYRAFPSHILSRAPARHHSSVLWRASVSFM